MMESAELPRLLREATKDLHRDAEQAGIMPEILHERIDRPNYCKLLRSYYEIYEALELGLERNAALPGIKLVHFSQLGRRAALAADLAFLHGPDWWDDVPMTRTSVHYANHLNTLSANNPELLIAHSYVRFLGDLNGGQILRKVICNALQLDGESGLGFYTFAAPGPAELATRYRQGLLAVNLQPTVVPRLVAEACWAFRRHIELFQELGSMSAASR